ncbi:MAG: hypothetical protein Q4D51_02330 [Eubacteriales bacterium]|nr:hypothetical protein [Eubacteriales bacterium]
MKFGFSKKQPDEKKQQNYQRVYELHENAKFLCYIDDVYLEPYQGASCVKLEGVVAFGTGTVDDQYILCNCNGVKKADITMQELYVGNDSVQCLEGGDKRVALYPNEQDIAYKAGDLLYQKRD